MLAFFVAIMANSATAQQREDVVSRTYEPGIYSDQGGEYRWQVVERRVWIPEYQTRGVFGVGSRTIPGHYEMRTDRVKVYTNGSRDGNYRGGDRGKGNHPHGMPPGQRKKMDRSQRY